MKKTAKYYKENPEARAKKKAYDTKYHATPERVNYREELNAANRKAGSKKGDGCLLYTSDAADDAPRV